MDWVEQVTSIDTPNMNAGIDHDLSISFRARTCR